MYIIKHLLKNYILLSILLILGACSSEPEQPSLPAGVVGTGDATLDLGTICALGRLGSVSGMTQWEHQSTETLYQKPKLSSKRLTNLFISVGKYKMTGVSVYNGASEYNSFNNQITYIFAEEGTLAIKTDFKLYNSYPPTSPIPIDKEEFTKLYVLTPKKFYEWRSENSGGKGEWEYATNETLNSQPINCYIVKESSTEMSMLWVIPFKNDVSLTELSVTDAINSGQNLDLIKK